MSDSSRQSDDNAFLRLLAESLGHALADNHGGMLVHVNPTPDGPDVGLLPLDGLAPADALLGTVAPDSWSALGVATGGWARPLDRPGTRQRADVVIIVARDGPIVGHVRHGDNVITDPPAYGLTLDCLQRALGLPTAPPNAPASQLLAVAWLERVLDAGRARDRRRPLTWPEINGLCPAPIETSLDWGRMRWMVVEGRWLESGLTPTDAAWLDDGAFSRWVLARRRPIAEMLAEVAGVIGRTEARRFARLLRDVGIETAA